MEKIGIRLDWALNSLSTMSFFLLTIAIYYLGKIIFKSKKVGILSVILFLFNGSWGFLEFFRKNPISLNILDDMVKNREFSSFGPYDGKIVSAFWSLNIFTNQRHLALGYASFLFLILGFYIFSKHPGKLTWAKTLLMGIFLGLFPFIHLAAFAMMGIALATFFLIYPKLRTKLLVVGTIAIILAIPQYLYMGSPAGETKLFNPGYLVEDKTLYGYLTYWFMNLGIGLILGPTGFILANKSQRKLLIPFIVLFIIGNLFQFSPEVAANHKFFNLYSTGANIFVAYLLVKLWKNKYIGKVGFSVLLLSLTLTGIIDLFPILNDKYITLEDIPNNKVANFIKESTPKDAVFLNAQFLYDPASIAGRKIFMGWPYFPWGTGYDTHKRGQAMENILDSSNIYSMCNLLEKEGLDYIEIQKPTTLEDIYINYSFFEENFEKIYYDPKNEFSIYKPGTSCDRLTPSIN
ncbi:hypothetical protein A3A52_03360 [Candidatus Woesebacteria bacterium RIFCSPLOWO2_01_FULL_39_14]|nr:MAG: hypothetical protein A3A52_03360 [Candidatus Woesebacteria bacterium RIFCSPLOWO2_01_FULL_39_14]